MNRRRLTAMGGRYVEQFPGEWAKLHARRDGALRFDLATGAARFMSGSNDDLRWNKLKELQRIMDDAEYLPEDAKP